MSNLIEYFFNKKFTFQFGSYFCIGFSAALVEWGVFWTCNVHLSLGIYIATSISFILATSTNWIIARNITFKNEAKFIRPRQDLPLVFIVSCVGLLFNLLLMWIIADLMGIDPMLSKIIATGIVFLWNFGARKALIYR